MPNLPRLSQAPFISPTNNMLLIPCFMDEVHVVSYLVLSITSNCLQLPASVFKVISLQPLRLDEKGSCVARGGHPPPALATAGLKQLEIGEQQQLVFPNFSLLEQTLLAVRKAFCIPGYVIVQQWQLSVGSESASGALPLGFPHSCNWTDVEHLQPTSLWPRSQSDMYYSSP